MSYPQFLDVARGLVQLGQIITQFGTNPATSTAFSPVTRSGFYRTPQVAGATPLRIRAGGNAADSAAGAGAREITLMGLDASGQYIESRIQTAGASQSLPSSASFLRLTGARVSASGTYATQAAPSHVGNILIEDTAGNLWATIHDVDIARSAAEIGAYSVPAYRNFYLTGVTLEADASNKSNVVLFQRKNILETAPPYTAMELLYEFPAFSGFQQVQFDPPLPVPQLTDIGFLAKSETGTITVSCGLNGVLLWP